MVIWHVLPKAILGAFLAGQNCAEMRVVDIYRRDGDKLAENWIFIDMLYFLNQQKLDILGRLNASDA